MKFTKWNNPNKKRRHKKPTRQDREMSYVKDLLRGYNPTYAAVRNGIPLEDIPDTGYPEKTD